MHPSTLHLPKIFQLIITQVKFTLHRIPLFNLTRITHSPGADELKKRAKFLPVQSKGPLK